ncbi:MAG: hypothetical protein ABWY52_03335 [Candidatus Limnocylindrales bacterium]
MPAEPRPEPTDEEIEAALETEQAIIDAQRAAGRPPPLEGFERWARLLCYGLGVLGTLVGIVAIVGGISSPASLVLVASIFAGAAVLAGVGWGLQGRRSWARPAAILLLWVLVIVGILRVVIVLVGAGNLTIPLEAILAALVLTTLPPGQRRDLGSGTDRSVAELCGGAYALAALLPLVMR